MENVEEFSVCTKNTFVYLFVFVFFFRLVFFFYWILISANSIHCFLAGVCRVFVWHRFHCLRMNVEFVWHVFPASFCGFLWFLWKSGGVLEETPWGFESCLFSSVGRSVGVLIRTYISYLLIAHCFFDCFGLFWVVLGCSKAVRKLFPHHMWFAHYFIAGLDFIIF